MKVSNKCISCGNKNIHKKSAILMPFIAERIFNWKPFEITSSHNLKTINDGNAYSIVNSCFCDICNLLYLDMRFDDEEIETLYKNYRGYEYNKLRNYYEPNYIEMDNYLSKIYSIDNRKKTEDYLSQFIKIPDEILDWGGGDGRNTPFLDSFGKCLDIFDISNSNNKNYSNVKFICSLTKKYDLIMSIHVFEHVPYPINLLNKISSHLNNNGYLYIEVPYEKIMRENKFPIHQKNHWHEHINFFSPTALRLLLNNTGFKVIDITTEDISDSFREFYIIRAIAIKNQE